MTAPTASSGRSTRVLIAAAILVVVVVGLVLAFGVERPPAFPTLEELPEPAPAGAVAWTAWDGDESCVHIARPDGSTEVVWCDRDGGELLAWTDEGLVLRTFRPGGEQEVVLDPVTGEALVRRASEAGPRPGPPTVALRAEREDGRIRIIYDDDTVLTEQVASDRYDVTGGAASPDERWVAATDTADRLLLLAVEGDAPVRVWASDVPAYALLVWEGAPLETATGG